jgi:hypothetical protein
MKDFRGPLPLDDRDFAEVRGKVMSKLERRRPTVLPFALAAAASVALIVILLPRPVGPPPPPLHHVVPVVAAPAPPPVKIAAHKERPVRKSAGSPPPDSEITMNIETADPNVRIIWIVR